MSRLHVGAPAVLAVFALAGCGGSSGPSLSAYKRGFQTNKANFRQLGNELSQEISGAPQKSDSQLASEFSTLSQRGTAQAANLRKLVPPSKYKSENTQLASAFDTVAADLKAIATSAATHNAAAARSQTTKLLQDAAQLKSVDLALSRALGVPTA